MNAKHLPDAEFVADLASILAPVERIVANGRALLGENERLALKVLCTRGYYPQDDPFPPETWQRLATLTLVETRAYTNEAGVTFSGAHCITAQGVVTAKLLALYGYESIEKPKEVI